MMRFVDVNSPTFDQEACGAISPIYGDGEQHWNEEVRLKRTCRRLKGHKGNHYDWTWYNWRPTAKERRAFSISNYDFDKGN